MIIKVSAPAKKKEVIELLTNDQNVHFKLISELGGYLNFEVDEKEVNGDPIKYINSAIRSQKWGKVLALSILPQDKVYYGQ